MSGVIAGRPDHPHPAGRIRARVAGLAILAVSATSLLGGCGGSASPPDNIADPGATAAASIPPWFPAEWAPPAAATPVEVIDEPAEDFGRSVTWRVDRPFDDVVEEVGAILDSLGWRPDDIVSSDAGSGTQQTTFYVENGTIFAVRVFADENLAGVRVTVELPAA